MRLEYRIVIEPRSSSERPVTWVWKIECLVDARARLDWALVSVGENNNFTHASELAREKLQAYKELEEKRRQINA